jgi:S-phase kinase-associated protein 1
VKLQTTEGEVVDVDEDIITKSILVKGMIDDGGVDELIPLPDVNKKTLEKVI